MGYAEQQEELLANAHVVVGGNLLCGEGTVVDGKHPDRAFPGRFTVRLIAQHQGETVVPVGQQAGGIRVDITGGFAIHKNFAATVR